MNFEEYMKLLKKYKEEYGDLNIPKSYKINDINLGTWVSNQRQLYKKGKLPKDKTDLLNSIGFIWNSANISCISFNETCVFYYIHKYFKNTIQSNRTILNGKELDIYTPTLNIAIEYDGIFHKDIKKDITKNKLCNQKGIKLIRIREPNSVILNNIPNVYVMENLNNESLEKIIKTILKDDYKLSLKININIEKDYDKILKIYNKSNNSLWSINYEAALEYYSIHKNLLISSNYITPDGLHLGNWISRQRQNYKNKTGNLTKEQIILLKKIGMVWRIDKIIKKEWMDYYQLLIEYKKIYDNLEIPSRYKIKDINLDQ